MPDEAAQDDAYSAFGFDGRWQGYAPIAFTNLLLTIITLGIYRFWGKARTRRYLWSHTRFIDDRLEWSGTGFELFKGAVMALVVIVLPMLLINLLSQALILHGNAGFAGLVVLIQFSLLFMLMGVALFRSLRYRLSRTYWRGIRGGSNDPGLAYGWSYLWRHVVGYIPFGLLMPWAMVALWNQRWNGMSFGPYPFSASGRVQGLMGRYLLCYLAPIVGIAAIAPVVAMSVPHHGASASPSDGAAIVLMALGIYFVLGIAAMAYYAKFFRQMVDAMTLHTLEFRFAATTKDWIKLLLGDIGLVVITLGIGLIFLDYRHWKFFISHMEAYGEIDMDAVTQSTTPILSQGEGLLDALDMGAL